MMLTEWLRESGYQPVGPAASTGAAMKVIVNDPPDAVILDLQVADGLSYPVAEELSRSGIPFLIATGFGSGDIDPEFSAPIVGKPFDFDLLEIKLQTILQPRGLRSRNVLGSSGGI
jgi:DNA-binding response OmpR family regulator